VRWLNPEHANEFFGLVDEAVRESGSDRH